jgi:hypothetical protein
MAAVCQAGFRRKRGNFVALLKESLPAAGAAGAQGRSAHRSPLRTVSPTCSQSGSSAKRRFTWQVGQSFPDRRPKSYGWTVTL